MEKNLTGIKDVDLKILSNLDDRSLMNFCKVSTYANTLCYNENFWRERTVQKYPEAFKFKSKNRTWRDYYLNIVMISSKFRENRAMIEAVKTGQKDLVEFFISQGADDLQTGMTLSANYGHKDLVLFFISKAEEDGEVWDEYDWNRGMINAIMGGHEDLVLFFISKGADGFNNGLAYAASKGNKKLVDLFISLGANDWEGAVFFAKQGKNQYIIDFIENKIKHQE